MQHKNNDSILYAPEIEQMALQAIMRFYEPNNPHVMNAFDVLDSNCFGGVERRIIFEEMRKLHLQGMPVSHSDLINPLYAINPELLYIVNDLNEACTINSLKHWCETLVKYKQKRAYHQALCESIKTTLLSPDCGEWEGNIDELANKLVNIKTSNINLESDMRSTKECVRALRKNREKNEKPISTGFNELDVFFKGGFKQGSLVVIGAPPSAGKTELSTRLLLEIAKQRPDQEALMFSLEMREQEITEKLIEHLAKYPTEEQTPEITYHFEEELAMLNIYICDKSPVSMEYVRSICKRAQMRNGVSVIVIDYLDKLSKPKGDLRSDEKLTEICNQLKNIAKEFNCIVILLTQLNKAAINRGDKRPNMNDSKNSNGAAENADYWLGIKRIGQWDLNKKYPDSNLVEVIIDKNRFGTNGIFYLDLRYHMYQEINQDFARQLVEQGNRLRKEDEASANKKIKSPYEYDM